MERQQTAPPFAPIVPWGKVITIGLSVMTALGLLMGTVYAAATVIGNKAERSEVRVLEDKQNSVREDLAAIKTDLKMIKEWVRPSPGDR